MEEREDSINDGWFWVSSAGHGVTQTPSLFQLVDYPASYNNRAAALTFADSHAEFHRWADPRTTTNLAPGVLLPLNIPSPNNPDIAWLQSHATAQ
jgi:hypothetical protein